MRGRSPALTVHRRSLVVAAGAAAAGLAVGGAPAGERPPTGPLRAVALGEGRSLVEVEIPAGVFASIGVFGPAVALRSVSIVGATPPARAARAGAPLDEDGLLPRVVSLPPSPSPLSLGVWIDVVDPVVLEVVVADPEGQGAPSPRALSRGEAVARPLVGVPPPSSPEDGWILQTPSRYAFLRVDVAQTLMAALRATRRRFRADPVAIGDASQWDGRRPASDRGAPRHISHVGGRDVDLGLPSSDGTQSLLAERCRGVRLAEDRFGCAPGTVRGLDAPRLAHLLGKICDLAPGEVTKIFLDDVYRREVIAAAPALVERRWLDQEAALALSEDGVLVASPWHTDHVHVRFRGEEARPLFTR